MQTSHKEDFEEKLEEALQPEGPKDTLSTTNDPSETLQKLQNQQQVIMIETFSQLHHFVRPENVPELEAIHASAPATAVIYVISVLVIYLVGLCLILIHHMNSAYGRWAWSLSDARDELKPLWSWADWKGNNVRSTQKRRTTSGSGTRKRLQKRTRFSNEAEKNDDSGEVRIPQTASCLQNSFEIGYRQQDSKRRNGSLITSASDPGPSCALNFSEQSSVLKAGIIPKLQIGYTKFRKCDQGSVYETSNEDQVNIRIIKQTGRLPSFGELSNNIAINPDGSQAASPLAHNDIGTAKHMNFHVNIQAEEMTTRC